MKLHDISKEIRAIFDGLGDGEISPDQMEALAELEQSFDEKAEATVVVLKELEAESSALKDEIDRLAARKKVRDSNVERLKDHLRMQMEATGTTKVNGKKYTVTLGKPGKSVEVFGEVPGDFQRVTVSADKKAIGDALKAGQEVPGAQLVTSKPKLLIK